MQNENQTFARKMATEVEIKEVTSKEDLEKVSGGCNGGNWGTFQGTDPNGCPTDD